MKSGTEEKKPVGSKENPYIVSDAPLRLHDDTRTSIPFDVTGINTKEAAVVGDWNRMQGGVKEIRPGIHVRTTHVTINGQSIASILSHEISAHPDLFGTFNLDAYDFNEKQIEYILKKYLLQNFVGDKDNAIKYLMISMHQGGFVKFVSTNAIDATGHIQVEGTSGLMASTGQHDVAFVSTANGFTVRDTAIIPTINFPPGMPQLGAKYELNQIEPDQDKDAIYKVSATLDVNLKDKKPSPLQGQKFAIVGELEDKSLNTLRTRLESLGAEVSEFKAPTLMSLKQDDIPLTKDKKAKRSIASISDDNKRGSLDNEIKELNALSDVIYIYSDTLKKNLAQNLDELKHVDDKNKFSSEKACSTYLSGMEQAPTITTLPGSEIIYGNRDVQKLMPSKSNFWRNLAIVLTVAAVAALSVLTAGAFLGVAAGVFTAMGAGISAGALSGAAAIAVGAIISVAAGMLTGFLALLGWKTVKNRSDARGEYTAVRTTDPSETVEGKGRSKEEIDLGSEHRFHRSASVPNPSLSSNKGNEENKEADVLHSASAPVSSSALSSSSSPSSTAKIFVASGMQSGNGSAPETVSVSKHVSKMKLEGLGTKIPITITDLQKDFDKPQPEDKTLEARLLGFPVTFNNETILSSQLFIEDKPVEKKLQSKEDLKQEVQKLFTENPEQLTYLLAHAHFNAGGIFMSLQSQITTLLENNKFAPNNPIHIPNAPPSPAQRIHHLTLNKTDTGFQVQEDVVLNTVKTSEGKQLSNNSKANVAVYAQGTIDFDFSKNGDKPIVSFSGTVQFGNAAVEKKLKPILEPLKPEQEQSPSSKITITSRSP